MWKAANPLTSVRCSCKISSAEQRIVGQKQQKKVPKLFLQDPFVDDYVCKLFSSSLTVVSSIKATLRL